MEKPVSIRSRNRRAIQRLIAALLWAPLAAVASGKPAHLTCDALVNPLGIDSSEPALSWQLQDSGFGARQTAYRIEVATKPALLASDKPGCMG